MPIQGISNQIFEFLISQNKKVQGFINSLKEGDILNGKVMDIFHNENKAIINFKGYNLISQLPQNINLQKGDVINVLVYNINDKVYMKLNNPVINNNETIVPFNNIKDTNILNILNSLKIPVNEHNLFVAQTLIKHQLPVNNEIINDINNTLINYLQNKGIDFRLLNIQNFSIAKEIILTNILKFNTDINELNNNIINQKNTVNQGEINNFSRISERMSNLVNISIELNKWIPDQTLRISQGSLYIDFNNINQNNLLKIIDLFNKSGINIDKNQILSLKSETTIQINNNISMIFNKNSISFKFENLINNFNKIINFFNETGKHQIVSYLDEIISNLNNLPVLKQLSANNLNPELYNLKNIFNEINLNIFQPNNTNLTDNINQISHLLNSFKNELQNIKSNNMLSQNDFNKISGILEKAITVTSGINIKNKITPENFINIQNTLKQFITLTDKILNFNNTIENQINIKPQIISNISIESIIESLAFLKTRNINIDNEKFIDIMTKYFANDMKLSKNLEKLNLLINNEKILENQFKNISDIINNIKKTLNEILIKPDNNNLKSEILLNQLKTFIDKSGLNIEKNIMNILSNNLNKSIKPISQQTIEPSIHILHNNLKSLLIKLSEEIDVTNSINLNNSIKKYLLSLKETSKDILNNLNAIQLINQKQTAIDLIYTQIPVFLDTKYFNGELQVWYRKEGLKQDLGKLTPVNILFILNTSNLGQIKLHLVIFKNQIDCIIQTQNEKSKQILTSGKNEFIDKLNEMNYKVNTFYIKLENELNDINDNQFDNQYIKLSNINLRA